MLMKKWIKKHRKDKKSKSEKEIKILNMKSNVKILKEIEILNKNLKYENLFKQNIEKWWNKKYFLIILSNEKDDYWLFKTINLKISY